MSDKKPFKWSPSQKIAIAAIDAGFSVFLQGSAGTGKSRLLQHIRDMPNASVSLQVGKRKRRFPTIAISATTGAAAVLISGVTFHSIVCLGRDENEPMDAYVGRVLFSKESTNRLRALKRLIIDETSMLSAETFDRVDEMLRRVRECDKPFGGIQLVCLCDFMQLQPVTGSMILRSERWRSTIQIYIKLTEIFRQEEPQLLDMLQDFRIGQLSEKSIDTLQSLRRDLPIEDGIEPTDLFCRKRDVEEFNWKKLDNLPDQEHTFPAQDIAPNEEQLRNLNSRVMAPAILRLKIGAQVMFLINRPEEGLFNGSCGVVEKFLPSGNPVVRFRQLGSVTMTRHAFHINGADGRVVATRNQYPLMLRWALTIHKAQGMTIDWFRLHLADLFAAGQAYVAFSRGRTLAGMQIVSFDSDGVHAHPEALEFERSLDTLAANLSPQLLEQLQRCFSYGVSQVILKMILGAQVVEFLTTYRLQNEATAKALTIEEKRANILMRPLKRSPFARTATAQPRGRKRFR